MPISFPCPNCRQALVVSDAAAGRAGKCPHCKGPIMVPSASAPAAITAARPPLAAAKEQAAVYAVKLGDFARKSPWPVIGAVIGGVTVLALLVLFFVGGSGASMSQLDSSSVDTLKYMPDNCQLMVAFRFDEFMTSPAFQELKKLQDVALDTPLQASSSFEKSAENVGIGSEDMVNITVGLDIAGAIANSTDAPLIMVIQTKKNVSVEEMKAKIKKKNITETKIGSYTLHQIPGVTPAFGPPEPATGFAVVDKRTVVFGTLATMKKVLERDQRPVLSETMQAAIDRVGKPKTFALAVSLRELLARPEVGVLSEKLPQAKQFTSEIDALTLQVHFATDIDVDGAVLMKSDQSADELRKVIEGFLALGKLMAGDVSAEGKEVLDAIKIAAQDKTMTVTVHLNTANLVKASKDAKQKGLAFPNQ